MQRILLGIGVSIVGLAATTANAASQRYLFLQANASAPAELRITRVGEPVKDEYLVFLVDGDKHEVPGIAQGLARAHQGQLIRVWNDGVQGFWVSMTEEHANAMLHDPHIRSIEENGILHESGAQSVGGSDPFWHLDRIDQRSATLDNTFQYCNGAAQVYAYVFDRGVRAADPQLNGRVLPGTNTGPTDNICSANTDPTQPPPYPDGASFMVDGRNPCGEHNTTSAGHGTAVATLLAGSGVGVSKTTIVIPLRVFNCENFAFTGNVEDALNWVLGQSNELWDFANERSLVPAVANFSISGSVSSARSPETEEERLVRKLIHGGVVVVASANNQNTSGQSLSQVPARLSYSNPNTTDNTPEHNPLFGGPERLIAVGGTMQVSGVDQRWVCDPNDPYCNLSDPGSNYGLGVDIWAPAQNIQSGHLAALNPSPGDTWSGAQYRRPLLRQLPDRRPLTSCQPSTETLTQSYARSGTSFSAPMVAGAAARLLSEDPSLFNDPSTTALAVWNRLNASATRLNPSTANLGAGSPNLFLYIGGVNFRTQPQSQSVDAGGSATLTAQAVGTGLSYRLYAGRTGDTSILVRDWQASGTFTSLPSTTKTYWIRATNTCQADGTTMTGDSAEATILTRPVVTATATSSSAINVSWTSDSGSGTQFDLFRAYAGSPFDFNQPYQSGLFAPQFTDFSVQANHTYVYKVRAMNGTATAMSLLPDYATTIAFTDADFTVSPAVKAVHILELRSAVNFVAEAMGIADPYTPAELNASSLVGQKVAAADFIDVKSRLNSIRAQLAYQLPSISFPSPPAAGGPILKSHLVNLRGAVN
jgi:hypothetical protein